MGAVMGSKNLKAVVVHGTKDLPAHDPAKLKELGRKGFQVITGKDNYKFWKRQGTMATVEWCQEANTLPTTTSGREYSITPRRSTATPWRR